jgi:hypothetical protein
MRVWFAICLLVLVNLPIPITAQDNTSEAPYIYYFDDILGRFVVERADGTEPRILQAEEYGFGWSASGEWYSWIANQNPHISLLPRSLYIAQTDGRQTQLVLTNSFSNNDTPIYAVRWSPTHDVVAFLNLADNDSFWTYTLWLYDPIRNTSERFTTFVTESPYVDLTWLADGKTLALSYEIRVFNGKNATGRDLTGRDYIGGEELQVFDLNGNRLANHVFLGGRFGFGWHLSPEGDLNYATEQEIISENIFTGAQVVSPLTETLPYRGKLSPD